LAAWCGRFSPIVGIEASVPPGSLLLDVTGLEPLFGSEVQLAGEILQGLAGRGLTAEVVIADTIGAAWAVAHFMDHDSGDARQRGLHIVPSGGAAAAVRPLPVGALRLPEEVTGRLHSLGIYQVEQLEALPRGELLSRFGPELLRRWDQATGRLGESLPVYRPSPELAAGCWLEYPTTRRETVERTLQELIQRVGQLLLYHGQGALRLTCRLDCPPGRPVELCVGLFQPAASAQYLFPLAAMQLERTTLPAAVAAIHVTASLCAPLEYRQQELFSDLPPRQQPRHLAQLIDRLSSRLGGRAVVRARLVPDAQPELAYRYDPLGGGARGRPRRGTARQPAVVTAPPRPLRLLPRPVALSVVSIVPDGPPLKFSAAGGEHEVARTWGPERIETGWWRHRPVGRDYYRVETAAGRRFWLFRRLRDGQWFMQGMFE
jgi:protein ImuB